MSKKDPKNLISLKEAAKLTGYSADYIGQLIRAGKIPGKQVYTNISWMTSTKAVMDYKNKKNAKNSFKDNVFSQQRKLFMELSIIRLLFQNFRLALPILSLIIISFILLSVYILHILFFTEETIQFDPNQNQQKKVELSY